MSDNDEKRIKIIILVEDFWYVKRHGSYISKHALNEFTNVDQLIRYVIGEKLIYRSVQVVEPDSMFLMKTDSMLSEYIPYIIRDNTIIIKIVNVSADICVCL